MQTSILCVSLLRAGVEERAPTAGDQSRVLMTLNRSDHSNLKATPVDCPIGGPLVGLLAKKYFPYHDRIDQIDSHIPFCIPS